VGAAIEFESNGGRTPGYLAEPAAGASARGVVVVQEWWGLNDHVRSIADRLAGEGYAALAPDLYHGTVTRSPDEAGKLLMALDIARAERDLRGAVAQLRARSGQPVGIVGFCMGGALSLFAACANGEAVAACVVYYGGHPKVEYDFDGLRAPVLGHWAEHDDFANANAARVEKALAARGKPFEFHRYPGTRHAFFNDERPQVYDRAAAETSWQRTLAFFRTHLPQPGTRQA
jgi:carboxymethylenebutenolidase